MAAVQGNAWSSSRTRTDARYYETVNNVFITNQYQKILQLIQAARKGVCASISSATANL